MVSESTFVRLVRASGWYDLIVTAPFEGRPGFVKFPPE